MSDFQQFNYKITTELLRIYVIDSNFINAI